MINIDSKLIKAKQKAYIFKLSNTASKKKPIDIYARLALNS